MPCVLEAARCNVCNKKNKTKHPSPHFGLLKFASSKVSQIYYKDKQIASSSYVPQPSIPAPYLIEKDIKLKNQLHLKANSVNSDDDRLYHRK